MTYHKRGWRLPILAALAALSMLLSACAEGAQQPVEPGEAEPTSVTAVRDWPVLWPMQMYYEVGLEKGFFAEEGLNVEFEFPPDPAGIIKLVGTGKAQFAFATTSDVITARLQGLDVVVVGTAIPRDMGGIMYFEDSGMDDPSDLAGKTIAGYAWPQTELHLKAMLRHYGLTLDDVRKVDAGDYSVPLMVSGKVDAADAAVGGEDLDTERATGREVSVWLYTEHGVPPFYNSLIVANSRFAEQNPEAVSGFLRGVFRSIDYTLEHPGEAVDITVANHPDADPEWLFDGWRMGIAPFAEPWPDDADEPRGHVSTEIIQRYMEFLLQGGLIEETVDPATFVDMRYLPGEEGM